MLDLLESHSGLITVYTEKWSYRDVEFLEADEVGLAFRIPKNKQTVVLPWLAVTSMELN